MREISCLTSRAPYKGEKPPICRCSSPPKSSLSQPQHRQGARPYHPRNTVGHRRRGDSMRTAGVHRGAGERGGLAGGGAGAADGSHASCRCIDGCRGEQFRWTGAHRGIPGNPAGAWLDRGPQHPDRLSLGWWRCRAHARLCGGAGEYQAGCDLRLCPRATCATRASDKNDSHHFRRSFGSG